MSADARRGAHALAASEGGGAKTLEGGSERARVACLGDGALHLRLDLIFAQYERLDAARDAQRVTHRCFVPVHVARGAHVARRDVVFPHDLEQQRDRIDGLGHHAVQLRPRARRENQALPTTRTQMRQRGLELESGDAQLLADPQRCAGLADPNREELHVRKERRSAARTNPYFYGPPAVRTASRLLPPASACRPSARIFKAWRPSLL